MSGILRLPIIFVLAVVSRTEQTGLVMSLSLSNATITRGSSLLFGCGAEVSTSKTKLAFKWTKDGEVINRSIIVIKETQKEIQLVELQSIQAVDGGMYECTITGGGRTVTSRGVLLVKDTLEEQLCKWTYVSIGIGAFAIVLLFIIFILCIRVTKYKRRSLKHQGSMSNEQLVKPPCDKTGRKVPNGRDLYPVHLPLPGMGLPKFKAPMSDDQTSVGKYITSSKGVLLNGDVPTIAKCVPSPLLTKRETDELAHSSSPNGSPSQNQNANHQQLCESQSLGSTREESVYESFRLKKVDDTRKRRERSASEPPNLLLSSEMEYAALNTTRKESLAYTALEPGLLGSKGAEGEEERHDNNITGDSTDGRVGRNQRPYPAPRPKKSGSVGTNEVREDGNDSEDSGDYLEPSSSCALDAEYVNAEEQEPRYINTKPRPPVRNGRNLYDAVIRKLGVDEDDESYYLRIRNSLYSKDARNASFNV